MTLTTPFYYATFDSVSRLKTTISSLCKETDAFSGPYVQSRRELAQPVLIDQGIFFLAVKEAIMWKASAS